MERKTLADVSDVNGGRRQWSSDPISDGTVRLALDAITIDGAKILRIQGYRDHRKIRLGIKNAADVAAREAEELIQAGVWYKIVEVKSCAQGVLTLHDGTAFENEGFDRFLKEARYVVVFILTMGSLLDDAVKASVDDDRLLHALFLETAGWLAVEAYTRQFSIHLRMLASKNHLGLSPRLGPGYSYKLGGRSVVWPLEQQRILFELFDNAAIGVQLLESCVMLPKISRSGLFGFLDRCEEPG